VSLPLQIINNNLKKINIIGVPGAGKTTLAKRMAALLPNEKFLYLSFGKENTINAKKMFGQNVTCLSFHALAKQSMNINTKRICSRITLSILNQSIKNKEYSLGSAKELEAMMILNDMFCISFIKIDRCQDFFRTSTAFPNLSDQEKKYVTIAFKAYWRSLWEGGCDLPITHDMYLKEFSQHNINLGYDRVFIDEKQDLNEAMFSLIDQICYSNSNVKITSFGDPCQQIFGFRGSSDLFSREESHYKLTNSHRFGRSVCRLANHFMKTQNISYYTDIESKKDDTKIMPFSSYNDVIKHIHNGGRPTFIARYNMTLWHLLKFFSENNISCSLAGGLDISELDFLKSLYDLSLDKKSNHSRLKGMSYKGFKRQAKLQDDKSSMLACKFVEGVAEGGYELFKKMSQCIKEKKHASVLLTTVHQAKGLEFKDVWLMKDFTSVFDTNANSEVLIKREEAHLLYTAITRAKYSLRLPDDWYSMWKKLISSQS
jgi:energy-coupling factor transporter ATP-binding protein EcfA2